MNERKVSARSKGKPNHVELYVPACAFRHLNKKKYYVYRKQKPKHKKLAPKMLQQFYSLELQTGDNLSVLWQGCGLMNCGTSILENSIW